jgi:hypothetical protein
MNRELLKTLHEQPVFQVLLSELNKMRPVVPQYDYKSCNIEEIKAKSSMQQGFDLAMQVLNPFGEHK